MFTTQQATKKQRQSCRGRNDNRPWGYSPSIMARWKFDRLAKDVKAGLFPKSILATRIVKMVGKKRK